MKIGNGPLYWLPGTAPLNGTLDAQRSQYNLSEIKKLAMRSRRATRLTPTIAVPIPSTIAVAIAIAMFI